MKLPPLALAAAMVFTLTACGRMASQPSEAPTADVTATPTPAAAPTPAPPQGEPPILDWLKDQPVPEFLDEEQQDLFLRAYSAATFLMGCSTSFVSEFPLADGSIPDPDLLNSAEYLELPGTPEGWRYREAVGRYAHWEDFLAMVYGLFTPEYLDQLLNLTADGTVYPIFTSTEDGRLCYLEMDRGSDMEYDWCDTPDSYELVSQTEDEIVFDFVGHYVHLGYDPAADMPVLGEEYTRSYPIRMKLTDMGWRFSEFHLPY